MSVTAIQQAVLEIIAILLPIIGTVLPGILKQNKLSKVQNDSIATGVVVVVSALQAWAAGKLGISPLLDFPIVVAGISALLSGPFHGIDLFLQSNAGFGTSQPSQEQVILTTKGPEPTIVQLPSQGAASSK